MLPALQKEGVSTAASSNTLTLPSELKPHEPIKYIVPLKKKRKPNLYVYYARIYTLYQHTKGHYTFTYTTITIKQS